MSKLGRVMMIGIRGKTLTNEEKKFIVDNEVAGVTLFDRNIESPDQVRLLCQDLQNLRSQMTHNEPLIIAIDQEGGRVARLKNPFTRWPALKYLGDADNLQASFLFARSMGYELKAVGINTDWAPCVDVFTNPNNQVIGDRAVSTQADQVARHGSALVRGYLRSGIAPCAKHFPGHGHTLIDSHDDLPVEDATVERLKQVELIPFQQAISAGVPLIMTGHLHFPKIDAKWPVSLSPFLLQTLLRQEMNYKGVLVTDDLGMKAMSKHYSTRESAVQALKAGADLLLYCNDFDQPGEAIKAVEGALKSGELAQPRFEEALQRVTSLRKIYLGESFAFQLNQDLFQMVGHPKFSELAENIKSGNLPDDFLGKFD